VSLIVVPCSPCQLISVTGDRLSRPSLALQHPLPHDNDLDISPLASLAYPSNISDQDFILSSNLTLPPAFGSAYVGETFACSLCANNELPNDRGKSITSVRIVAEMQTPSQHIPLQLVSSSEDEANRQTSDPDHPLQRIIRFDLKEEGNHVLAIHVAYNESTTGSGLAPSTRQRSFRKLYQFAAQPCLSVRTKATEMPPIEVADKSLGPYGRISLARYALEAQLENVSDSTIVLEQTDLHPKAPFKAVSLSWDAALDDNDEEPYQAILNARDVLQVAYLVEQEHSVTEGVEELKTTLKRDGRVILGQLSIRWRGGMGEVGYLSTGNLLTRKTVSQHFRN
jgi:trafficking protein particle complex subunit 13